MKQFYFKFEKKTFFTLFLGMFLLMVTQGMYATGTFTTTTAGGNWSDASTWEGGVVPPAVTKSDDIIIINGDVTLTLNAANTVMTTVNTPNRYTFTIGSVTIAEGKTLNVTSLDGAQAIPYYFTIGSSSVPSAINGNLNFDASIWGGKLINTVTVSVTGSIIESKLISLSTTANSTLTNYGTITTGTLAPSSTAAKIENYGTINYTGFSSTTTAITTNYAGGFVINTGVSGGTFAGNFKNYGTYTAAGLTGTAATANFYNYSTGVLNFSAGSMSATNLNLYVSYPGNTVNYNFAGSQTIKLPADGSYSNITFSNSGTKTIPTATSATLCTGTLRIIDAAKAGITNTNVGVAILNLGGSVQLDNTYGGASSTAVVKNSTYFTFAGSLNVQNSLGVSQFLANEVKLYPNPSVGGKFSISLPFMQEVSKVSILNVAGKTVYTNSFAAGETFDVNPNVALARGVYFVKIEQAEKSTTKKLIIN